MNESSSTCTQRGGALVGVVTTVVDTVAQQIGRYAKIFLGAAEIAADQLS